MLPVAPPPLLGNIFVPVFESVVVRPGALMPIKYCILEKFVYAWQVRCRYTIVRAHYGKRALTIVVLEISVKEGTAFVGFSFEVIISLLSILSFLFLYSVVLFRCRLSHVVNCRCFLTNV